MSSSSLEIVSKSVLEISCLTILTIPMLYVHIISDSYQPFQRGFFCDDQNLKHPYVDKQTVPMEMCFFIWAVLIIFSVVFVEILRLRTRVQRPLSVYGRNIPWLLIELYRQMGFLILGGTACFLFTDLSKFTIGRLRPHFLSLCQPDYGSVCKEEGELYQHFVTEDQAEVCHGLGGEISEKMLREARLSFMSGHASFSFYSATFLIIYLQARLNKIVESSSGQVTIAKFFKVCRPFIQFGIFMLAFWIALTRISDYFHHPLDVIMGSLVGISFAILTLAAADIFRRQTAFWKVNAKEYEKQTGQVEDTKNEKKTIKDFVVNNYEFDTA